MHCNHQSPKIRSTVSEDFSKNVRLKSTGFHNYMREIWFPKLGSNTKKHRIRIGMQNHR